MASCGLGPCEVWTNWSACSETCGPYSKKSRQNLVNGQVQTESCNLENCRVMNTDWSECSASCGKSYKTKTYNGRLVQQICQKPVCVSRVTVPMRTTTTKNEVVLAEEDLYTKWSSWSRCTRNCGSEGVQKRRRYNQVTKHAVYKLISCFLLLFHFVRHVLYCEQTGTRFGFGGTVSQNECVEERKFEEIPCHRVDCPSFSEWVDAGECSKTCGRGYKRQTRYCVSSDELKYPCSGVREQQIVCQLATCPPVNSQNNNGWMGYNPMAGFGGFFG